MPTLDRDYIPTVGIGKDSSYLQTVVRVKTYKMAAQHKCAGAVLAE